MTSGAQTGAAPTRRDRRGMAGLLVAETVSSAGTRMSQLALPWLVLTTTHSPVEAGLVGTAEIAPYVVLQVLGAPLVDRLGGRRVAVVGNAVAGVAMVAVPVLASRGVLAVGVLLALVFVAGLLRGPADTATQILLPAVARSAGVPIERAAALFDGASRAASLVGAPLGGVLIAVMGAANVVALDAASFAVAAVLLLALVPTSAGETADAGTAAAGGGSAGEAGSADGAGSAGEAGSADGAGSAGAGSYVRQLREGVAYVGQHRLLRSIAGMVLFTNLVDAAVSGLLLLLWAQEHYGGTTRLGLVVGTMGAGAVCGTALMAVWGARAPRRWTFALAFLLAGCPRLVVLALPVPYAVVLVVWFLGGLAAGAINPVLAAVQYDLIPRSLQARVLSAVNGVAWGGIPFGALLAGLLVGAIGLRTTLVSAAVLYAVVTLDPFLRPVWRGMDRAPDPADRPAGLTADPTAGQPSDQPSESVPARPSGEALRPTGG